MAATLEGLRPSQPRFLEFLRATLEDYREQGAGLEQMAQNALALAKAAALLETTVEVQKFIMELERTARDLGRFEQDFTDIARRRVRAMSEKIDRHISRFGELVEQLDATGRDLPNEFEKMRQEAIETARALKDCEASELLGEASDCALNSQAREARKKVEAAIAAMLKALEKDPENEVAGMCRGQQPGEGMGGDLAETLRQMLGALRRQGQGQGAGNKPGLGSGGGGSGGGDAANGSFSRNRSLLDLPIFGPERRSLKKEAVESLRSAGGKSGRVASGGTSSGADRTGSGDGPPGGPGLRNVPPKYREAAKSYFSDEE